MSLKIAVVGAGPAGFYATEALAREEGVTVDLIDRLPTPYGLIRSGVAPDHQTTKRVVRKYDETAARDNVRYVGNVEIGRDISVATLQELYDAVVFAYGAEGDRPMGIPGEDKANVFGSFAFVGWYNAHPDFADLTPDLDIDTAVVIGNGNVALDCARLLVRDEAELATSDIADPARAAILASALKDVHILGRRGPVQASFSIAEMREMAELNRGLSVVQDEQIPEDLPEDMDPKEARSRRPVLEVLKGFRGNGAGDAEKTVHFQFFLRPVEILGGDRVEGLRVERTRLEDGRAVGTGEIFDIPCQLVIGCIGYLSQPLDGLPMDGGIIANTEGRIGPGLYCVGWAKRGPSGTIGANRPDAQDVVARLLADLGSGGDKPGPAGLDAALAGAGVRVTDYDDWAHIDAAEIARADVDAPRRKFPTVPEMLTVLDGA